MSEKPISELAFLRKLQRLLEEGDFSSTYKFALLNALADLSVERELDMDGSLRVPLDAIAQKFIEYYWPQARPYKPVDGGAAVLRQNAGRQAEVLTALMEQQRRHVTLAAARRAAEWHRLVRRVTAVVDDMPLWKLQNVGGEVDEFLYRRAEFVDGAIRLLPGVPEAFRALYGIVLDTVRGAWIRRIGRITSNRPLLGDSDLAEFLFGSGRRGLDRYGALLREHQAARCLYCGKEIRGEGVVDHFIAWARYPADLAHNLVLADRPCNAKKRDFLAYPAHVERWRRSHLERAEELAERCNAANLMHDARRAVAVAWWAYEQGQNTGAHAWVRADELVRLDGGWRDALRGLPLPRVAEPPPPPFIPHRDDGNGP